jgi:hypothetical protein
MSERKPKKTPKRLKTSCAIRQRLQFVLQTVYNGKITYFAKAAGMGTQLTHFSEVVRGAKTPTPRFIATVVNQAGINAEFLLCGTGPVMGTSRLEYAAENPAPNLEQLWPRFDTTTMQFTANDARSCPETQPGEPTELALARKIHATRGAGKPVIVYLTEAYAMAGACSPLAEMLRKRYVTAVAMTGGAAYRDVELARFAGCALNPAFPHALIDINEATILAASSGIGYGEALGRWCYPRPETRCTSVIATAYEIGCPVTVHTTIGESPNHWFPVSRAAQLGAAIGAATYTDMLVLTEYFKRCSGSPGGVFISSDIAGLELYRYAVAATQQDALAPRVEDVQTHLLIGGEFRLTFPALLTSCDAVYDGSADDGRRHK